MLRPCIVDSAFCERAGRAAMLVTRAVNEVTERVLADRRLRAAIGMPTYLDAALARRHANLRMAVSNEGGRPTLDIADEAPSVLTTAAGSDADAGRRAREEAMRPFDLTRVPGWRATALRAAPARTLLIVTMHPLVGDARALAVLARDLGSLLGGEPMTALPFEYGDFAARQRRWLTGEEAESELAQRASELAQIPPFDPAIRRRGAGAGIAESPAVSAPVPRPVPDSPGALCQLASQAGVGVELAMLAMFAALLGRLSGDTSVGAALVAELARELAGAHPGPPAR